MLSTEPQVIANYADSGKIRYVYYPILDFAPTPKAYQAAECAGEQDPSFFWAIHDLFYEEQGQLWSADTDLLVDFAGRAGVTNLDQFRQCLDSGQYADKATELDRARRAESIRLRPTFSINGELIPGAQSYAELSRRIDAALAR